MLATANGLKESLGEYWTDGLVILWLKPRSGTRRFNQRPPSTSVREIISSNGGFNLRFCIPGFAVATGPDVSTDEVIANCGTKWLGNTSLPGREVKKQKIDGNNWEEEVAQAAAVLALEQLKDWATAPSFEGQVNSADRLFLQLQRIHELFPPNDKKVEETYKNELDEAVELMERIRRNASVEYHSSRFILALKVIEPAAIPAGTFFTGLGANDGPLWAWACAGMAFGAKLMMHLVLKMSHVDETPILQLPRRTVESDN